MVKQYDISGIPMWRVSILTSVLAEYGAVSTVTLNDMQVEYPDDFSWQVGRPMAESKSGLDLSQLDIVALNRAKFLRAPKLLRESEVEGRNLATAGMTVPEPDLTRERGVTVEREYLLLRFPELGDYEVWYKRHGIRPGYGYYRRCQFKWQGKLDRLFAGER